MQNATPEREHNRCTNCKAHVTPAFVRVFGVDGSVDACPECTPLTQLGRGAPAGRDL